MRLALAIIIDSVTVARAVPGRIAFSSSFNALGASGCARLSPADAAAIESASFLVFLGQRPVRAGPVLDGRGKVIVPRMGMPPVRAARLLLSMGAGLV